MRLWILLLVALLATYASAGVVKRQAELSDADAAKVFENAPVELTEEVESPEEIEDADPGFTTEETAAEQSPFAKEEAAAAATPAADEQSVEHAAETDEPVHEEIPEPTQESSAAEPETQETPVAEEQAQPHEDPDEDAEFMEEPTGHAEEHTTENTTEEPAAEVQPTAATGEQSTFVEPIDETIAQEPTADQGETHPESLPMQSEQLTPVLNGPVAETEAESTAQTSWMDDCGWIHYPWQDFPIRKSKYSQKKECGCKVMWIKQVYKRFHPKPKLFLKHSSYYEHPKPITVCDHHRHHHHHHHGHGHHHHVPRPTPRPKPCTVCGGHVPHVPYGPNCNHGHHGHHGHHHHHHGHHGHHGSHGPYGPRGPYGFGGPM